MVVFLSQLNNLEIWGADVLEMHILKPTLMKSYASWLDQNSKNYTGPPFDHDQSPVRDLFWGSQVA